MRKVSYFQKWGTRDSCKIILINSRFTEEQQQLSFIKITEVRWVYIMNNNSQPLTAVTFILL